MQNTAAGARLVFKLDMRARHSRCVPAALAACQLARPVQTRTQFFMETDQPISLTHAVGLQSVTASRLRSGLGQRRQPTTFIHCRCYVQSSANELSADLSVLHALSEGVCAESYGKRN